MLSITESTIEMHFHAALMGLFRETLGLGATGQLEFFKYSPQMEKFVGFDQAYVKTEMSAKDLHRELLAAAAGSASRRGKWMFGYFLQFKLVQHRPRHSKSTPRGIHRPYFMCKLSTQRGNDGYPSQHELLCQLARNPAAMVYYACPMLFDRADLYRPQADLDSLRLVDVSSCYSPFIDNERHSICFQTAQSDPLWCSEPVQGRAILPKRFADLLRDRLRSPSLGAANAALLVDLLFSERPRGSRDRGFLGGPLGGALTLLAVSEGSEGNPLRDAGIPGHQPGGGSG
jgi:hypothetical protein